MGIKKYGDKEPILPDEGDDKKTASANWSEQDQKELAAENERADQE